MRIESVPSELTGPWRNLRFLCGVLLACPVIYLTVMAFVAHGHSEGAHSLLDWTGVRGPEALETQTPLVVSLIAVAVVDFAGAFLMHGYLLKHKPSLSSASPELLATPLGRAFGQFRIAKILGMGLADGVAVIGLILYLLFGHFLIFALPPLLAGAAAMLALSPSEQQLIEHLEERVGADVQ